MIASSSMYALLSCLACIGIVASEGAFESCLAGREGAESWCLQAIDDAERENDRTALVQLLDALGVVYEREGQDEKAIAVLERALTVAAPDRPFNTSVQLANVLQRSERLTEAREVLSALVATLDGRSPGERMVRGGVELQLAEINRRLGDLTGAEEYYRRSIDDLAQARRDLSDSAVLGLFELLVSEGREEDAVAVCARWKESQGLSPRVALESCLERLPEENP